jgi:DMSO/TMAO reductase YedYZ molybdopterin-dependent catalytic subunit
VNSPFRPDRVPDAALLDEHRPLIRSMERRGVLRGALSLGALTMLTGCKLDEPSSVAAGLRKISDFNDRVQAWIFDPNKLARTYPASMVQRPPRFNAYYDIMDVKVLDGSQWRLELAGLVGDKTPWTAGALAALPQQEEIIRHVCVEGWDYIGQWSGVTLKTFLERVGADTKARYVNFFTADDYPSSIDMATALHPQTLLATGYGGEVLPAPFGYPLRLRTATKLGYKNPKWITAIEVTNTYMPGYWEQRGFSWFGGI